VDIAGDGDGADTQLATGAQDAHGDFTPISDQNFLEHERVERDASLAWREASATSLPGFCASAKLIHKLLQILPLDEDDVIFFQGLFEFGTGDKIKVALTPRGAEVRVIQSYSLQFGIVMTEVDNHFAESGFEVFHGVDIKISPLVCVNGGIGHDHRIENDVLFGEDGEIGRASCRERVEMTGAVVGVETRTEVQHEMYDRETRRKL